MNEQSSAGFSAFDPLWLIAWFSVASLALRAWESKASLPTPFKVVPKLYHFNGEKSKDQIVDKR